MTAADSSGTTSFLFIQPPSALETFCQGRCKACAMVCTTRLLVLRGTLPSNRTGPATPTELYAVSNGKVLLPGDDETALLDLQFLQELLLELQDGLGICEGLAR